MKKKDAVLRKYGRKVSSTKKPSYAEPADMSLRSMNIYRAIHRAPPVKVHLIQAAACISIYILKCSILSGTYGDFSSKITVKKLG